MYDVNSYTLRRTGLIPPECNYATQDRSAIFRGQGDDRPAERPLAPPLQHPRQIQMVEPPQHRDSHAFPNLEGSNIVDTIRSAIASPDVGRNRARRIAAAFTITPITPDQPNIVICNYTDSSSLNFVANRADRPFARSQAELRRECRGLVLQRSGGVLVRPFHRFFAIGQTPSMRLENLDQIGVAVTVTRKLDGQMVVGVVVDGMAQFWTKGGPTETGVEAFRVAMTCQADYSGLIEYAAAHQSTPMFEYTGRRSHKKAFEGSVHRVVLLAVRFNSSGDYWTDDEMRNIAGGFGVPAVQRLYHLEGLHAQQLQDEVSNWHNCEGVVVRFSDNSWVKFKSDWWKKTGYSTSYTDKIAARIKEVKQDVEKNIRRGHHHLVRLAVRGLPNDARPGEVAALFPACCKVEMVHQHQGKLTLAMVTFGSVAGRDSALHNGSSGIAFRSRCQLGSDNASAKRTLRLQKAYSCRTRSCVNFRVTTHISDDILLRHQHNMTTQ